MDAQALLNRAAEQRNPLAQARLQIRAASVLAFNAEYQQAISVLESLATTELADAELDEVARLLAQAHTNLGQLGEAEASLTNLSEWRAEDMLLLAQICEAQNKFSCAADGYIQASIEYGLDATELPADINDKIWLALSRAQVGPTAYTHRYHHGWWLLQERIRTAGSITGQIQAWQDWQNAYPSHPARIRPPQALTRLNNYQAPQVGFLLPLSGQFSPAGRAVRDGLIAAYLSESSSAQPQIKFYDTAAQPLPQLFEQALSEGADVLVGPLLKPQVDAFAELTQFSEVPRLVLNYLSPPGSTPPDPSQRAPLYQLGVAIEDEAVSLANHVMLEGAERLLVVHSRARWSQRAFAAYTESWPYAVTAAPFSDIKSLTGAVGEAMQVAASETRKNEVATIIGTPLEFLPRARRDLDGVVALITQVEAQALVPALRFHFADDLPVYATSQAARGESLQDLAGFALTEMPMFAAPNADQQALQGAFALEQSDFAELYALGFDAYRVATWLPLLTPQSQVALPAASGYLWLESGGKFRRDLPLSRINRAGERTALN